MQRRIWFRIDDTATSEWAAEVLGAVEPLGVAVELFSTRAALRFAGPDESSPGFDDPVFDGTVTYTALPE